MHKAEVFVETDVLAAYLTHNGGKPSVLRTLAAQAMCFTSVQNATECIAAASNENERYHTESVLWGLKVLGFHHKYSLTFGDTYRQLPDARKDLRSSIIAGLCVLSKLPLATYDTDRYAAFDGLAILDAATVQPGDGWNAIQTNIIINGG
ncbi:MAG: hypothetical protein CL946_04455 [Ectothiorhodospiraceae bacterium]|nr:hypothetical protein [Ectothiorhodospiraceae bacterium]